MRLMLGGLALCATMACASGVVETSGGIPSSPDAFAGAWRSVTPSLEFIRLSVSSKSSEQGVMAARLTFSGVAWEGSGRIEGDSLRLEMSMAGSAVPTGVLVVHVSDTQTLRAQARPATANAFDLTLVRTSE